ncbi:DUF692 domain-containing protein [Spongiibacter sp. KMU-166]|uniref:UPF0276 protein HCU74_07020 n=1 Tax=Spongiibacter thalassae TaxID=2721624 RepID=A0ABX1GDD9_9GAMM|nr:DUF692 domain-containing protein [Spongiibacter thalassae]NKI17173.1 DUF692 domain-containing protein [Spongiibacter thalassae]
MRPLVDLPAQSAGLGLRRALLGAFDDLEPGQLDFIEVAPENWIGLGGRYGRAFARLAERYPVTLHGLSLNIGGFAPLDSQLIDDIAAFIKKFDCKLYSEHLTYCGDEGHLYDLMPIPFTEEAVKHVAARVREVQDRLGQQILLENASYYAAPAQQMSEVEFITAVLSEADCGLLLDVNNIYVNSINHRYDPYEFLRALPLDRAAYIHIAGHYVEAEDLRVDTHGTAVIDPVWQLLDVAYAHCGPLPTLLERDFNFPTMAELMTEVDDIRRAQMVTRANMAAGN